MYAVGVTTAETINLFIAGGLWAIINITFATSWHKMWTVFVHARHAARVTKTAGLVLILKITNKASKGWKYLKIMSLLSHIQPGGAKSIQHTSRPADQQTFMDHGHCFYYNTTELSVHRVLRVLLLLLLLLICQVFTSLPGYKCQATACTANCV